MTKHKRTIVKPFLLIALFLFSTFTMPFTQSTSVSAETQGLAGLIYDEKVYKTLSAHQHYWWLYSCFKNTDVDPITPAEMDRWDFFQGNSNESALGEMYGNDGGGTANCETESVVKTAFGYLGESSPREAFCKITGRQFGGESVDYDTCVAGPGEDKDWDNNKSFDERTASYKANWGSKDPGLPPEAKYMRAYSTLMQGCDISFVNDTVYTDLDAVNAAGAEGTSNKFPIPIVVANTSTAPKAPKFVLKYRLGIGVNGPENQIVVANSKRKVPASEYTGGIAAWESASCDALAKEARDNALAYAIKLEQDGITADPGSDTTGDQGQPTPTCEVNGFGWVICPLIGMMADATSAVADFLDDYLRIKPLTTDTGSVLYKGWSNILTLANVVLIIAFLLIVFSQATSIGIGNYGIKKLLPRIIAAAVLINLSYFICAVMVDISNIVGANIAELIYSSLGGITSDGQQGGLVGGIKNIAGGITAGLIGVSGLVVVAFFFLVPAVIAILSIFIVIAARSAIITLLIIIAPLAFAAWVLPNTEKWFRKWWDIFLQMLVVYPAIMAIFAASSAAAAIVVDSSAAGGAEQPGPGNLFPLLIGLLIQALPLFALPALIKLSSGLLARLDGITKNGLNKSKSAYDNSEFGKYRGMKKREDQRAVMAGNYRANKNPLTWKKGGAARINRSLNTSDRFNQLTRGYGAHRVLGEGRARSEDQETTAKYIGDNYNLAYAYARSRGNIDTARQHLLRATGGDESNEEYQAGSVRLQELFGAGLHRKADSYIAASRIAAESGFGNQAMLDDASDMVRETQRANPQQATKDVSDLAGAMAIPTWRAKGRGDLLPGDAPGAGWSQVAPENISRHAFSDEVGNSGQQSLQTFLRGNEEKIRQYVTAFDRIEARAQPHVQTAIEAASGQTLEQLRVRYGLRQGGGVQPPEPPTGPIISGGPNGGLS